MNQSITNIGFSVKREEFSIFCKAHFFCGGGGGGGGYSLHYQVIEIAPKTQEVG